MDEDEAARQVRLVLELDQDAPDDVVSYEVLRTIAWASTRGQVPISTRALLDRAMGAHIAAVHGSTDEQTLRRDLRGRLDMLAAVGDLAPLGRGRWLSVIGSIVRLDDSDELLLVSGIPLRYLDSRGSIAAFGPTRTTVDRTTADRLRLPVVGLEEWARVPRQSLATWTREVLDQATTRSDFDPSDSLTQIYAPENSEPSAPQRRRWTTDVPETTGPRLARRSVYGRWTDHAVVDLDSGRAVSVRNCDPRDARRLMYGIDQSLDSPSTTLWLESGSTTRLHSPNPLPHAETRMLLALGAMPDSNGWNVPRHKSTVHRLLSNLGIDIRANN
ncbi:hypothetical protein [Rhodococcus kronopolitis]|uniref:Uncharacterized protein n=1 Tax=Rhodococcus kronopolitis TaxID=1460226 RepID=A0ABV9FWJ7_9NOCA